MTITAVLVISGKFETDSDLLPGSCLNVAQHNPASPYLAHSSVTSIASGSLNCWMEISLRIARVRFHTKSYLDK